MDRFDKRALPQNLTLAQKVMAGVGVLLSLVVAAVVSIALIYVVLFFLGLLLVVFSYFFIKARFFSGSSSRMKKTPEGFRYREDGEGVIIDVDTVDPSEKTRGAHDE